MTAKNRTDSIAIIADNCRSDRIVPDHIPKMASTTEYPPLTMWRRALVAEQQYTSLLKEKVACLEKEVEVSKKRCRDGLVEAEKQNTSRRKLENAIFYIADHEMTNKDAYFESSMEEFGIREEEFLKGLGIDIQTETRTIVSFSAGGREIGEIEE